MTTMRAILLNSLKGAKVGRNDQAIQDGRDFYKFLFEASPVIRRHFVGAAIITSDDIQTAPRFAQQGQRFLLAIHVLASSIDNDEAFSAYAREIVNKHIDLEVDPRLWKVIFEIFANFLETKGEFSSEQRDAWLSLGDKFYSAAQAHLNELSLPTDPE
ncbi:hypothetical protein PENTCL1PPCAC_17555, partial [Pristionchus entomophagus]